MTAQLRDDAASHSLHRLRGALAIEFEAIRARIEQLTSGAAETVRAPTEISHTPSALDIMAALFGLTPAEQDVLTLAAAAELDPGIGPSITSYTGSARPTVALANALNPADTWDALCPEGPLRRWRMIDLVGPGSLVQRELAVDERILHFLMGVNYVDTRLAGLVSAIEPNRRVDTNEHELVQVLAAAWSKDHAPVVLFGGADNMSKREILIAAAAEVGLRVFGLQASDLPTDWTQRSAVATFVDRELKLSDAILVIECTDDSAEAAIRLADDMNGLVALAAADPPTPTRGPRLRVELANPSNAERRAMWQATIGPHSESLGSGLARLAEQFRLDRSSIEAAVDGASRPETPAELFPALWKSAREQGRRRLHRLAERIDSTASWDDLVLPVDQMAQLRDLAGQMNEAWRVNEEWGWSEKSARGLGTTALFAGPSGTGKTLAAEVLAGAADLDLYRIDLSQVISKWIGETEKNLSRIFIAAENSGAILFFDEADALFGKRSEVKDSHDRYANIEVSYLLQRMEAYRGLAILTSNQKSALDRAFLRRLRYVITMPFPDVDARAQIWGRIFPNSTPTEGLDPNRLARLNVAGGSIRSIALNASFLAANANSAVRPEHVLSAAHREYAKLEKPFTSAEIGALT